jgi:hypothetical protein
MKTSNFSYSGTIEGLYDLIVQKHIQELREIETLEDKRDTAQRIVKLIDFILEKKGEIK